MSPFYQKKTYSTTIQNKADIVDNIPWSYGNNISQITRLKIKLFLVTLFWIDISIISYIQWRAAVFLVVGVRFHQVRCYSCLKLIYCTTYDEIYIHNFIYSTPSGLAQRRIYGMQISSTFWELMEWYLAGENYRGQKEPAAIYLSKIILCLPLSTEPQHPQ